MIVIILSNNSPKISPFLYLPNRKKKETKQKKITSLRCNTTISRCLLDLYQVFTCFLLVFYQFSTHFLIVLYLFSTCSLLVLYMFSTNVYSFSLHVYSFSSIFLLVLFLFSKRLSKISVTFKTNNYDNSEICKKLILNIIKVPCDMD